MVKNEIIKTKYGGSIKRRKCRWIGLAKEKLNKRYGKKNVDEYLKQREENLWERLSRW